MSTFYERIEDQQAFDAIEGLTYVDSQPLIPCDAGPSASYNLEAFGGTCFRITLAAPGFADGDIEVFEENGFLYVIGDTEQVRTKGETLHQGLQSTLACTFLLLEPLSVVSYRVRDGLLVIELERERVPPGRIAKVPPIPDAFEQLELAA